MSVRTQPLAGSMSHGQAEEAQTVGMGDANDERIRESVPSPTGGQTPGEQPSGQPANATPANVPAEVPAPFDSGHDISATEPAPAEEPTAPTTSDDPTPPAGGEGA